jgi:predicted metalloprotease with PDZ domain
MRQILFALSILLFSSVSAQDVYEYSSDLTKIENDAITVSLTPPRIEQKEIVFTFPKIIPGTYSIADYGKFISDVKAVDKAGKALPVKKLNDNQWRIGNATRIATISYKVDDIFDATQKHKIYPMAATNFEDGKNLVLNLPGVFGFIEGKRNNKFRFTFRKPALMYASTSLKPVSSDSNSDVFEVPNVDQLYDYPILYSAPDTASVQVGNCNVLVSVYSPNKAFNAKQIAGWMNDLLDATLQYLGGKLPADKYAFIFYFKDPTAQHAFPAGLGGALEHTTSSFYYLPEGQVEQLKNGIVDICSHEFFHIITPLTIASKEVKEFNFNEAVLSKHLWLYEGVTEYSAHHVQAKYGLNSAQQFLDKLSGKITTSRTAFKDDLAFTEMSVNSAGKHADQFGNVYQKGALISACIDLYLLHLSNGRYGLRNLTYDLGVRFGKKRYFNDDELFDEIADLSYPQIAEFLRKYVASPTPIPYDEYFKLAGIAFTPKSEKKVLSMGNISLAPNARGVIAIQPPFKPNEFGKKLGYKEGDEIYAFNGESVDAGTLNQTIATLKATLKEGDMLRVKVGRKSGADKIDTIELSAPIALITQTDVNKLEFVQDPTEQQKLVRDAWLKPPSAISSKPTPKANAADVQSVDAIMKAIYEVISGPAGKRDWNRFMSLFTPDAKLGAIAKDGTGQAKFFSFSAEQYQKQNAPFLEQSGFFEEELRRKQSQFGNVANILSSYQYRLSPGGKVEQRGLNFFTLIKTDGRWWISHLVWQDEEKDLPLPSEWVK